MTEKELTLRMAVELLGIDCDTSKRAVYIHCPNCSSQSTSKRKTMNLNFDKFGNDDGVFRCSKCDIGGRPLHFWGLYRGIGHTDAKAAAHDYYSFLDGNKELVKNLPKPMPTTKIVEHEIATLLKRDATYNALLDLLTLSEEHKKALLKRGLTEETIKESKYRSYPMIGLDSIARKLITSGYILEGVPGFYKKDNGTWSMVKHHVSMLIPQRNGLGKIQGMQLRYDDVARANGNKYVYFSSRNFPHGAAAASFCHFRRGFRQDSIKDIVLTEGPLKADIIAQFTGYSVIAIPGVNSIGYLKFALMDLKRKGLEKITIAFDMDLYTNQYVFQALVKLKSLLQELEVPYTTLNWDSSYKGLDDWLYATKHKSK